jgi:hypothetical protein
MFQLLSVFKSINCTVDHVVGRITFFPVCISQSVFDLKIPILYASDHQVNNILPIEIDHQ